MTDKELDDLEARLRDVCFDYDGSDLNDLAGPRGPGLNCGEIRQAADAIAELRKKTAGLVAALSELHAVVEGECPSLFNEDSGGDAKLAIEIENLLNEEPQ